MSDIVAVSASYLLPEGYGNANSGRRTWEDETGTTRVVSDPGTIPWSSLFDTSCSRFGRMDLLSKLSLMTVELLGVDFAAMPAEHRTRVGVCMLSPSGSIATDIEFLLDIGPSTFIYTLPSSAIGEICIRHQLKGPALCLTSEEESGRTLIEEASERMAMGETDAMICLACDVRTPAANRVLNSALDNPPDFCWYAYCLYLARKDRARHRERGTTKGSLPSALKIRDTCLELCGKESVSAQGDTSQLGDGHVDRCKD